MLKLFCFPRSGNSREVKIVLAEKNIPFEQVNTHAPEFNKEDPEFRKASPQGKVPAIIDGATYLSEAYAINVYLEAHYPTGNRLLPEDEKGREAIREWVAVYDKKLVLKIGHLVIECLLKPKDQQKEETKQRLRGEIREALGDLDQKLIHKPYLFGDFSLADVSVIPHIAALPILGMAVPTAYTNLTAWLTRIQARPSFQQSLL